jgi:DeoR/GlpR family transcriptional regulator of sugar metabolism
MLEQRLHHIQQLLFADGYSSVQTLAERTQSSEATVRRDLERLSGLGLVTRTRGGARLAQTSGAEIAFQAREHQEVTYKRLIAEAAYKLLRPGSTVLLDAGTTVLQLARMIRRQPIALTVITNSFAVTQELLGLETVKLFLLGGQIRPENLSSVGVYAEEALKKFWIEQLFLGSNAVHFEHGLSSHDSSEASLNALMLERSETRILLADSSKFGSTAMHHVAPLTRLSRVITDSRLPKTWVKSLRDNQVKLETVAGPK